LRTFAALKSSQQTNSEVPKVLHLANRIAAAEVVVFFAQFSTTRRAGQTLGVVVVAVVQRISVQSWFRLQKTLLTQEKVVENRWFQMAILRRRPERRLSLARQQEGSEKSASK